MDCKRYTVNIVRNAEEDIDGILNYIAVELANPTAAARLWKKFRDGIEAIAVFPDSMPALKSNKEYRRMDIDNFVMIYKKDDENKTVTVSAAFYAMSDVAAGFLRRL